MASDFKFQTEQTVNITANVATPTVFIPGNDGDGRRLLEARIMATGTFDSGTLVVQYREPDGATYVDPPPGAYSVTTADTAGTQIFSITDTELPGAGFFYKLTGGGGSLDVDLNWSATYG